MDDQNIKLEDILAQFKAQSSEELKNFRTNFEKELSAYKLKLTEIEKKFASLSSYEEQCKAVLDSVKQLKVSAQSGLDEIKKVRAEILDDPSPEEYSIFNDIKDSQSRINNIFDKVNELNREIFGYRKKIPTEITPQEYAAIKEPENKEIRDHKHYRLSYESIPGVKDKLNSFINEYKTFLKEDEDNVKVRDEKANEEINSLLQRIENLLPGATAAGLSASYDKAEKSARTSTWLWALCFIASIASLCAVGWAMYNKGLIIIDSNMTFFGAMIQLLRILCFEFPFIWLAWASNIKISQYTRLTEEYRHKWAMMRIFDGMRSVLKENDSEQAVETRDNFYRTLLQLFSENPSTTLDKKYDPDGPFSALKWFQKGVSKCSPSTEQENEKGS